MNKICVYTCVVGDFDYMGYSERLAGVDYLYITTAGHEVPDGWIYCPHPFEGISKLDDRRMAKIPKCAPHLIPEVCNYDYAVWVDGDMEILDLNFPFELLSYLGENRMVVSPHFDGRNCAYGEAEIRPEKYQYEPLDQQIAAYAAEGFPRDYGLYEGGVIGRDLKDPAVREVGLFWLTQNLLFSYQDQISLPYVFWKLGFKPSILPKSFREFGWVRINAHKNES